MVNTARKKNISPPPAHKQDQLSVLVGVIRRRRDLDLFLRKKSYRAPADINFSRRPRYLAPYLTSTCGRQGGAIRFYAEIIKIGRARRNTLLPKEKNHPRDRRWYHHFQLGSIHHLSPPVENRLRRRVTFAYTSLELLKHSRELGEIFGIPPLEEIFRKDLLQAGIRAGAQFRVIEKKKCRYRLDFAVFCRQGRLALECDHSRWHRRPSQQRKDRNRDRWLRNHGWEVIHFSEDEIIGGSLSNIARIKNRIRELGGAITGG